MNVFALIFAILCLLGLSTVSAMPATQLEDEAAFEDGPNPFEADVAVVEDDEHGVRLARATCDLLSFSTPWGSANHSICAAHCISMRKGFKGGRCIDGVCNCRR